MEKVTVYKATVAFAWRVTNPYRMGHCMHVTWPQRDSRHATDVARSFIASFFCSFQYLSLINQLLYEHCFLLQKAQTARQSKGCKQWPEKGHLSAGACHQELNQKAYKPVLSLNAHIHSVSLRKNLPVRLSSCALPLSANAARKYELTLSIDAYNTRQAWNGWVGTLCHVHRSSPSFMTHSLSPQHCCFEPLLHQRSHTSVPTLSLKLEGILASLLGNIIDTLLGGLVPAQQQSNDL
eukprot:1145624-Pelagomonas_calceolata.AAC.6